MLDGKRCTGVRYSVGGEVGARRAAAREVVVSAGTINSPQLLELSGIGQPERLRDLGIEVRQALAGRRREPARPLRAAHALGASARKASPSTTGPRSRHGAPGAALCAVPQGLAGSVGAPMRAFVCSREGLEAPDLLLGWVPMLTEPGPKGRASPTNPALPATPIRCGRRARGTSTSPRPIRTGRPRSTSTSCRRRPMRS